MFIYMFIFPVTGIAPPFLLVPRWPFAQLWAPARTLGTRIRCDKNKQTKGRRRAKTAFALNLVCQKMVWKQKSRMFVVLSGSC